MKKLVSMAILVLVFSIFLISPASASDHGSHSHSEGGLHTSASDHESHSHSDEEGGIQVQYIPCPGYNGKHMMTMRGYADVHLGNGKKYMGWFYQCKHCNFGVAMDSNVFISPKPPGPGYFVSDTLPHQMNSSKEWTTKHNLSYGTSWTTGIFASISFVNI